jgi:hypothetical protein
MRDGAELPDGYVFSLDTAAMSVADVAEWIRLEHCCCPFLSMELTIHSPQRTTLTITGPTGTKAIIETEFPAATRP